MLLYMQMIETADERDKFERIYRLYRSLMFYVAMQLLHNTYDAEDAVHQAFVSIIENLDKISEVDCPKTRSYAVIITERKAIDIVRRNARTAPLDCAESGIEIPPPGDGGLADAMARLPARYREVLLLRYDNGFSAKEIAKLLDIKPDSVQKLLWRAKEALKKQLEKEDESSGL